MKDINTLKTKMLALGLSTIDYGDKHQFKLCLNNGSLGLLEYKGFGDEIVEIPYGIEFISDNCFKQSVVEDEHIKKIIIPNTVNSLGKKNFQDLFWLEEINIPPMVGLIPKQCFQHCCSLVKVDIQGDIHFISEDAFFGCSSLEEIGLGKRLKFLGENSFAFCKSLRKIIIPNTVTSIGQACFAWCESLKYAKLPIELDELSCSLFLNTGLTEIEIPKSVKTIGKDTFYGCYSLKKIVIHNESLIEQFEQETLPYIHVV